MTMRNTGALTAATAAAHHRLLHLQRRQGMRLPAAADDDDEDDASIAGGWWRRRLDCSGSRRGLFIGLGTLVAACACLLAACVLGQTSSFARTGSLLSHSAECFLLGLALIAALCAFPRLADLMYLDDADSIRGAEINRADQWLQTIGLSGLFAFSVMRLVLGPRSPEAAASAVLQLLQTACQTALVSTASRMRSYKALHLRDRPGRELVTFLAVSNVGLLAFAVVEPLRADGSALPVAAAIASALCRPLCCLYRLHSVICLSRIWRTAYLK